MMDSNFFGGGGGKNLIENDYEKYMSKWLNGIKEEIRFWITYIAQEV